jgi:hypothetical protein
MAQIFGPSEMAHRIWQRKVHTWNGSAGTPSGGLAHDITSTILDGRQPPDMTAETVIKMSNLPCSWTLQRQRLGFQQLATPVIKARTVPCVISEPKGLGV